MDETPNPSPDPPVAPAAGPSVTDRRPTPRGVLPRGVQTWLMAGLAVGMLAIMLIAGRPEPAERATTAPTAPDMAPNADRVRDYQDRLRALEAQALLEAQAAAEASAPMPFTYQGEATAPEDPLVAEQRRREYESLFASNLVLSRRAQTADAGVRATTGASSAVPPSPSIDDIADAVIRASTRATGGSAIGGTTPEPQVSQAQSPAGGRQTPDRTGPIDVVGPLHRVLEGTLVDAVLTNRLDGTEASPVNCLVTNPLYSHSGQHVLIPAGARLLGETKPVQSFGETRLAVSFHRLLMPDGRTYRLDQFTGLEPLGDAGLRDRVNQHYLSTFGAAAAVGLISGLSQFLGTGGMGRSSGDRTVIIGGGVSDATSQTTAQVMNRFLNRLPSITIREGHRIKVYLTSDLELPAYVITSIHTPF